MNALKLRLGLHSADEPDDVLPPQSGAEDILEVSLAGAEGGRGNAAADPKAAGEDPPAPDVCPVASRLTARQVILGVVSACQLSGEYSNSVTSYVYMDSHLASSTLGLASRQIMRGAAHAQNR